MNHVLIKRILLCTIAIMVLVGCNSRKYLLFEGNVFVTYISIYNSTILFQYSQLAERDHQIHEIMKAEKVKIPTEVRTVLSKAEYSIPEVTHYHPVGWRRHSTMYSGDERIAHLFFNRGKIEDSLFLVFRPVDNYDILFSSNILSIEYSEYHNNPFSLTAYFHNDGRDIYIFSGDKLSCIDLANSFIASKKILSWEINIKQSGFLKMLSSENGIFIIYKTGIQRIDKSSGKELCFLKHPNIVDADIANEKIYICSEEAGGNIIHSWSFNCNNPSVTEISRNRHAGQEKNINSGSCRFIGDRFLVYGNESSLIVCDVFKNNSIVLKTRGKRNIWEIITNSKYNPNFSHADLYRAYMHMNKKKQLIIIPLSGKIVYRIENEGERMKAKRIIETVYPIYEVSESEKYFAFYTSNEHLVSRKSNYQCELYYINK